MIKFLFLAVSFSLLFVSCKNNVDSTSSKSEIVELKLLKDENGTAQELEDVLGEDYNILIDSDFIQNNDLRSSVADKDFFQLKSFTRLKMGKISLSTTILLI